MKLNNACVRGIAVRICFLVLPWGIALADATDDSGALEEVVVTAQHRHESLQQVPISAQVVSAQSLQLHNLESLPDVSLTVPSVHIGSGGGRTETLFIRGIGSGQNQSFDQSVGTFIDDIYHGRSHSSEATFLDLDHLEILKGPQSTFFGNNAIAGAFNIVTRKPTDSFEADARAYYGMFNQYTAEAAAGGPITDKLGVRVAASVNGGSGWIRNVYTALDQPDTSNKAARATFVYRPVESLDVTWKIEGSRYGNSGAMYLQGDRCPPPAPFTRSGFCASALTQDVPIGIQGSQNAEGPGSGIHLRNTESVLTANYHRWGHTFTSVTGYYAYNYDFAFDLDFTPANLLNATLPEQYHQLSEELRVASPAGQTIEYMAGVYFQTDHLNYQLHEHYFYLTPVLLGRPALAPLFPYLPLASDAYFSQAEQSHAAFGSIAWNITEQLKIAGGFRESWVTKDFHDSLGFGTASTQDVALPPQLLPLASTIGLGNAYTAAGSRADHAALPSAKIQYQITPEVMTYFSYAKGFKAGGFNGSDTTGLAQNQRYDPEHVNAYELGLKSEWLQRSLVVNAAVFRSEYTGLQESQNIIQPNGAVQGVVRNAAGAQTQGVELEVQSELGRQFRLSAEAAYDHAYYTNYKNVPLTQLQSFCHSSANFTNAYCVASFGGGYLAATQDLSGRPTQFAPRWSGSVTGTYTGSTGSGVGFVAELTEILSSSYYMNDGYDDPMNEQHFYARTDARLGLLTPDGQWSVDIIGRNLTDRTILSYSTVNWPTSLGSAVWQKQQPRTVGIQVRYQYGVR